MSAAGLLSILQLLFLRACIKAASQQTGDSFTNHNCQQLIPAPRMVYLHFQKAAGTTVENGLKRFIADLSVRCGSKVGFDRPSGSNYRSSTFSQSQRNAGIVAGHGYWGCHKELNTTSSSYVYTAFFRNPLTRALSHFARSSCKAKKNCSIQRFLRLHARNYYYNRLVYNDNLVGGGEYGENLQNIVPKSIIRRNKEGKLLDLAKKRIDSMPFVGLVEEFDSSMLMFGRFLSQYFGLPDSIHFNLFYCRSQNSFISTYKRMNYDRIGLERYLWLDHEIFEFAKQKFASQKKAFKAFEKALEEYKTNQKQYDSACCHAVRERWCFSDPPWSEH